MKCIIACLLVCMIAFSISCKRDSTLIPSPKTNSNNSSINWYTDSFPIKNFIFKSGSYWIYQDSVLNTLDSCYVLNTVRKDTTFYVFPLGPGQGPSDVNERFYYNNNSIKSYQYNYYIHDNFISFWNLFGDYAIDFLYDSSNHFVNSPRNYYNSITISSYTIGGLSFTNVYKCFFNSHHTFPSIPLSANVPDSGYYYLKPGVGIIKTIFYFGLNKKTYNLLRYTIN